MNSLRTSEYNLRTREQRARESLDERFQRRSARNAADRLRRARARSDQQMANRVNSQAETNVSEHDCGMMTEICNFCQALYWRNELNSSNKCCHDGKVRLPNLAETSDLLKELLTNNSLEARNYQQHIREYNAALAFASIGAEVKSPPGNDPYCFEFTVKFTTGLLHCILMKDLNLAMNNCIFLMPLKPATGVWKTIHLA
ncbi:hypothetical protein AVEN_103926-1 [Araneus ventricosus]|uniref:Helitron helicase-like domain-containing protein n=1 Tax=Araneus ventricosus TaxID=182803 RepID=A0A4Y2U5K7_ARAVE|nr:hypothetical protein AVEN_103926-1 [Araneus ventricosus]